MKDLPLKKMEDGRWKMEEKGKIVNSERQRNLSREDLGNKMNLRCGFLLLILHFSFYILHYFRTRLPAAHGLVITAAPFRT